MKRWAVLGPMLGLPLLVATCQDAPGTIGPPATARDSGSVSIVESAAPALRGESAWRVAAAPAVVYGDDIDEAKGLGRAGIATVLSDGKLVAIDYASSQLRYFSPDGESRYSAGGPGEGPGEFRNLSWLWRLPGDTLVAYDQRLNRVSRFGADGSFHSMATIASEPFPPRIVGTLDGGGYLGKVVTPPNLDVPDGTPLSMEETYVRISVDGETVDTLATLAGDRSVKVTSPDGGPGYGPVFARFGPGAVTVVGNGRLYHGFSDRFEIAVYDPSGGLIQIIRRLGPERRLTPAMIEASELEERRLTRERRPSALPEVERRLARARYPEALPAFDWLLIDEPGNLWVRWTPIPGESSTTWSVFSSQGAWMTDVRMPAQARPAIFHIGRDYVLIRETDGLGLQSFARYPLIKGNG